MSYATFSQKLFHTISTKYTKLVGQYLTMEISDETEYSSEDTLQIFSFAGISRGYITSAADQLRVAKSMKTGNKAHIQTGETAIDRIRFVNSKTLFEEMKNANAEIVKNAIDNKEFPPKIVAALDIHDIGRHSKISMRGGKRKRECTDIKTVVGTKPKNGISYAHKYMTIQNIKMKEEIPTYVLAFDRVLPLADSTKIAEKIIDEVESKIGSKIYLALGDGGFDDVDKMKMFIKRVEHFIVSADQDSKVKKIIDECKEKNLDCHMVSGYVKGNKYNNVSVNLVVVKVEWLKSQGIKVPLVKKKNRYLSYFTDFKLKENECIMDFCIRIVKLYKKRWGIETGYRDINQFEAKTHSLSDSVRLFLYLQAILLYNIWVQINYGFKDDPDRKKYFRDGIPKSMIKFLIELSIIEGLLECEFQGPLKR